jgi:3-hydroxyacyl-CoA dehydrogenase
MHGVHVGYAVMYNFLLYLWEELGYNVCITTTKEDNMSNIQDAIEQEIADQIETRIDDAIYENSDVQQLKSDVDDLESRLDVDEIVEKVLFQLAVKQVKQLEGEFVMVKKSYLKQLEEKEG